MEAAICSLEITQRVMAGAGAAAAAQAAKEEAEAEAAMKVGTLWWSILKTVNAAHLIPFS